MKNKKRKSVGLPADTPCCDKCGWGLGEDKKCFNNNCEYDAQRGNYVDEEETKGEK